jgi:site-specific recombinase XerD
MESAVLTHNSTNNQPFANNHTLPGNHGAAINRYDSTNSINTHPAVPGSNVLSPRELRDLFEQYMQECEMRLYAARTLETRRLFIGNLLWFLDHRNHAVCSEPEIHQFFYYLAHGHTEPGGRFGRKNLNRPVRPVTMKDYYNCLRPFFAWLVERRFLKENPFQFIPPPHVRVEVKSPLSLDQIQTLFESARRSTQPLRDTAILSLLLDTGCRASELIAIQLEDVDWQNRCCRVLGKGNKYRTLYFGDRTGQALQAYVEASGRQVSVGNDRVYNASVTTPLFLSDAACLGTRDERHPTPLTRSGLLQLMKRLGKAGGIKMSCSPHALRRTFAVQTLRNGANVFSVQAMLGHTDLQMTRRYCAIAHADVEAQHRQFAPMDRLELHAA